MNRATIGSAPHYESTEPLTHKQFRALWPKEVLDNVAA
jgi:hypothetical protein